jgi:signal recognition particle GTPase
MSSFTLDDFRNQLNTAVEPGLLLKMTRMLPANSPLHQMLIDGEGIKQLRRQIGIVDSMTVQERKGAGTHQRSAHSPNLRRIWSWGPGSRPNAEDFPNDAACH